MCYHPYLSNFLEVVGLKDLREAGLKLEKDQYFRLKKCAEKGDMTDWNAWREKNLDIEIWLSGADLRKLNLLGANLKYAHLEYSNFYQANLEGVNLYGAQLVNAYLSGSILIGTDLECANLKRARARGVIVNGWTLIWHCEIDEKTDFAGVVLDDARIDPKLKEALIKNINQVDENEWYGKSKRPHSFILHLSDLHFGTNDDAQLWSDQLISDISIELNCPHIDVLVISGDVANRSTKDEYVAAKIFIDNLCREFQLQEEQIIIVPGNHDINWDLAKKAYKLKDREEHKGELKKGLYIEETTSIIRVCDEDEHKQRFAYFSQFYEAIKGSPYPLEYEQQGILYHLPDQKMIIAGLNSAWQIDHHFTACASIHPNSLTNISRQLRENPINEDWLKIAVWHHPLISPYDDRIKEHDFMQRLSQIGFHVALHGHIHKAEAGLYHYDVPGSTGRRINLIGAGTFGAPIQDWTPGYPLQYNLIKREETKLIVETRKREEINGTWKPDARWTTGSGKDPLPRYEIILPETPTKSETYKTFSKTSSLHGQEKKIHKMIFDREQNGENVKTEEFYEREATPIRKVLILAANPKDTSRLRLDEEVREIEEGLRRSKHREQFTIQSKWAVRLKDLRRAMLDEEPQIVHFCGHGEEDGLMVEDDHGNAILVNPDALAGLFELFRNKVECVLLNACYSQLQAEAINKHINYVIGMRKGIQDTTAIKFAGGFYDALGAGKSIEDAFKFGSNAIQLYDIPEHLTPVLKKSSRNEEQSFELASISIPNLNKTDKLVLKLSCEYILSNKNKIIERDRLFAQEESLQVPEAEFKESLDILERYSYVKLLRGTARYTVTAYGFVTYVQAQAYLPEYKSIIQGVITLIGSKDISGNRALAESLNQPIILIDYILERLEEKNLLQLSKKSNGFIRIYKISPELKRMVKG